MIEGGACGRPGVWHIIWENNLASNACEDDVEYARTRVYQDIHRTAEPCKDPRGLWFPKEHTCRIPQDAEDYLNGQYIFS